MASNTFHLVIASVGETRFDGAVLSATMPGDAGEFTVLPHHEPLVTTLKPGVITLKKADGSTEILSTENGVFECSSGRAVVLL